jgi:hypothetical protein
MPALVAIQRSPQIKAAYEAVLVCGKKKKVTIIALMRRLLHAIWGMLHHHQDFTPQLFPCFSPSKPLQCLIHHLLPKRVSNDPKLL